MSADIIHDPNYPHGTVEGFTRGCRGSHCPAPVTCHVVHTRYQGDYGFRKAIDAGETAAQVVEREQKTAEEAARAAKGVRLYYQATPRPAGHARPSKPAGVPITQNQHQVLELHGQGLTDRQIAEKIGKTRDQVSATRKNLRLKPNVGITGDDLIRTAHAKGLSDILIAADVNLTVDYVRSRRRHLGLVLNPHSAMVLSTTDLVRLHTEGLTDRQIGETLNVDPKYVARRRRKIHLQPNPAPATSGASS